MEENEVKENQEVKEENVSTNQECEEKETSSLSSKKKKKKDEKSNKELLKLQQEIENLTEKYKETNDKYLRLAAEFDNYKKRTLKEKSDLLKYGGETVLTNLLSILDDFERAENSIKNSNDIEGIKQGIDLINAKFHEFMKQQGIKEIESKNAEFNTDFHEAITRFPAPSDELKGKVIDVIQKGYMLHDKVIRFAKVVVGE
ncbi:MAG TPA: nucleotide exchange factor GrpE [Bacteroidales bacterium]|nr:nucleotide exchange factor GrpE [Bacteroidales bacterium]HOU98978.1 nucleotide exchange factor GrpE [Bacteroidales bacterium]